MKLRHLSLVTVVSFALVAAACGGTAAPAPAAPSPAPAAQPQPQAAAPKPALRHVTLRLDWLYSGYHAPFFVAIDRGYYKDAGLDVTIGPGQGSLSTLEAVANGSDDFGFADGTTMMQLVAKGAAIKDVLGVAQKGPDGVVFAKKSGIQQFKDICGKTLAFAQGGAAELLLPAVVAANHLPADCYKKVGTSAAVKVTAVADGRADAFVGVPFLQVPQLESIKPDLGVGTILYADAGVNVPGFGLVTTNKMIAANPDVVRGFVAATVKGFQAAQQDPMGAVETMKKYQPKEIGDHVDLFVTELKGLFPLMHASRTQGKPLGWIDAQDWSDAQVILLKYANLAKELPPATYFTNDFVPQG